MKRVTYISHFARPLGREDLEEISSVSVRNNGRDGLSGALFCFRNIFYQILEGEEQSVDRCLARIAADDRHNRIFYLQVEQGVDRRYSDWQMQTVILDENTDKLIRPIRSLLDSMAVTHQTLEQYIPPKVLDEIQKGRMPQELPPSYGERTVMFIDLFRSTTMFERWPVEPAALILQKFYDNALKLVKEYGGIISKLTGDGLMAYWDANETNAAVESAIEIQREFHRVRSAATESSNPLRLLYAGIGLSSGRVLEGNIGNSVYRDYTLLGDTVNTAARMESVTRKVGYGLVFDDSVLSKLRSGQWKGGTVRKVALHRPKGKTSRVPVYSIALDELKVDIDHDALQQKMASVGLELAGSH
ncbi:MAG: BLUF domain-containing protein [Leptospiraceae bacterium]|nr:BLUF domain-containing protein [Leptospiraceae bacterium]MCB1302977.1 BLUF domain-containing protein [Leptospiraceae bacterium]